MLRLKQILMNLVSNSIKFTSKGGVTIIARFDEKEENIVKFEVIDTGRGIEEVIVLLILVQK